jgi:hypothetical protein
MHRIDATFAHLAKNFFRPKGILQIVDAERHDAYSGVPEAI